MRDKGFWIVMAIALFVAWRSAQASGIGGSGDGSDSYNHNVGTSDF